MSEFELEVFVDRKIISKKVGERRSDTNTSSIWWQKCQAKEGGMPPTSCSMESASWRELGPDVVLCTE